MPVTDKDTQSLAVSHGGECVAEMPCDGRSLWWRHFTTDRRTPDHNLQDVPVITHLRSEAPNPKCSTTSLNSTTQVSKHKSLWKEFYIQLITEACSNLRHNNDHPSLWTSVITVLVRDLSTGYRHSGRQSPLWLLTRNTFIPAGCVWRGRRAAANMESNCISLLSLPGSCIPLRDFTVPTTQILLHFSKLETASCSPSEPLAPRPPGSLLFEGLFLSSDGFELLSLPFQPEGLIPLSISLGEAFLMTNSGLGYCGATVFSDQEFLAFVVVHFTVPSPAGLRGFWWGWGRKSNGVTLACDGLLFSCRFRIL